MDFDMFLGILHDGRFSKWSHFSVFCTEQLEMICRMDFHMFFGILIFDRKRGFWKGHRLCMMADFINGLIFLIFGVFSRGFLHRTFRNDFKSGF